MPRYIPCCSIRVRQSGRFLGRAAPALVLALLAGSSWAAIPWHADMQTARTASNASRKPVFVVFTASWSPESTAFEQRVLASPEAESIVTACFEPVRVDVDQRPGLAKRLEVAHVPSACVLGADDAVLARFDCPETPTAFIAAAAKAGQDAAARAVPQSPALDAALATGGIQPVAQPVATSTSPSLEQPSPQAPPSPTATVAAVTDTPVAIQMTPPPTQPMAAMQAAAPQIPPPSTPWLSQPVSASPAATVPSAGALPEEPEASATVTDLPATNRADTAEAAAPKSGWSTFVETMQKPFASFTTAKPKAIEPPTLPPAKPESPLAAIVPTKPTAPEKPDPHGSMPLGLEGYCPVTLADRNVWVEGRAQWGARHRGRTYLFAGPEQQQAFLANPDRYAPALSGDDPVVALEHGRSTPGRRAYGVTYQSRMYLFSSTDTRAAFAANPERYTSGVMLAERPVPMDVTRRY